MCQTLAYFTCLQFDPTFLLFENLVIISRGAEIQVH